MVGVVAVTAGGSSGTDDAAAAAPVAVALTEFAISPAAVVMPLGGSLEVTNNGTMSVPNLKTPQPYNGNFLEFTVLEVAVGN
jgi:hypothetical protein